MTQKENGAYYTPAPVAATLVRWALRGAEDRLLDPACGDGGVLAHHPASIGVERCAEAAAAARGRAPNANVVCADFFAWAASTPQRFDCAAGNPPFIRYQRFGGETRGLARDLCGALGVRLSGLCSSWAPWLLVTASLLRPGGRMAFVVPAEIGHAPYAAPALHWFAEHFANVTIVAIRRKVFAELSEDTWLLYADGYGGRTDAFRFAAWEDFAAHSRPPPGTQVTLEEWRRWGCRLRPMLLAEGTRRAYRQVAEGSSAQRLGRIARLGIGYVSGDNGFFHLRPSEAERLGIGDYLRASVTSGRQLRDGVVDASTVDRWRSEDRATFLVQLDPNSTISNPLGDYLASDAATVAQGRYKCRVRNPWYAVPNVIAPDMFLAYMSTDSPALARNDAGCVCSNAVHAVRLNANVAADDVQAAWDKPLTRLSCELEGHPLGGGLLKLEPREATRVLLATDEDASNDERWREGIETMRRWRHRA